MNESFHPQRRQYLHRLCQKGHNFGGGTPPPIYLSQVQLSGSGLQKNDFRWENDRCHSICLDGVWLGAPLLADWS